MIESNLQIRKKNELTINDFLSYYFSTHELTDLYSNQIYCEISIT